MERDDCEVEHDCGCHSGSDCGRKLLLGMLKMSSRHHARNQQVWTGLLNQLKTEIADHEKTFQELLSLTARAEEGNGGLVHVEDVYRIFAASRVGES